VSPDGASHCVHPSLSDFNPQLARDVWVHAFRRNGPIKVATHKGSRVGTPSCRPDGQLSAYLHNKPWRTTRRAFV